MQNLETEEKNSSLLLAGRVPTYKYAEADAPSATHAHSELASASRGRKEALNSQQRLDAATDRGGKEVLSAHAVHCICKVQTLTDPGANDMVECENPHCTIGWYHFACAGV